jgi:hypothetical protein
VLDASEVLRLCTPPPHPAPPHRPRGHQSVCCWCWCCSSAAAWWCAAAPQCPARLDSPGGGCHQRHHEVAHVHRLVWPVPLCCKVGRKATLREARERAAKGLAQNLAQQQQVGVGFRTAAAHQDAAAVRRTLLQQREQERPREPPPPEPHVNVDAVVSSSANGPGRANTHTAVGAGRGHGRSVQPGFWNNYVHKCVFSAAAAPIDLAAAWPADRVRQ